MTSTSGHAVRQELPWPPFPEADYMLSRYVCSCGWKGNSFIDSKKRREARELAQQEADEHRAAAVSSQHRTGTTMSSKISDERLAELLAVEKRFGPAGSRLFYGELAAMLAELAEYRAREAASEYALGRPASMPDMSGRDSWTIVGGPHSNYRMMLKMAETRPEVNGQPVTILARRVGPWEAVGDDD